MSDIETDRVDELAQVFHAAEHEVAHYGSCPWEDEFERTREAYRSGIRAVLAKLEETS